MSVKRPSNSMGSGKRMVSGPRGVRLGELTFVDVSKEAIKLHGELGELTFVDVSKEAIKLHGELGELTFVDVSKEAIKLHGEWEADGLRPARGEVGGTNLC